MQFVLKQNIFVDSLLEAANLTLKNLKTLYSDTNHRILYQFRQKRLIFDNILLWTRKLISNWLKTSYFSTKQKICVIVLTRAVNFKRFYALKRVNFHCTEEKHLISPFKNDSCHSLDKTQIFLLIHCYKQETLHQRNWKPLIQAQKFELRFSLDKNCLF